jgi:hypothetical protein
LSGLKDGKILKIVGLDVSFQNIYNVSCLSPDSVEAEIFGPQKFDFMTIFKEIIVLSE